jgi:hypothetical protein
MFPLKSSKLETLLTSDKLKSFLMENEILHKLSGSSKLIIKGSIILSYLHRLGLLNTELMCLVVNTILREEEREGIPLIAKLVNVDGYEGIKKEVIVHINDYKHTSTAMKGCSIKGEFIAALSQ